MAPVEASPRKAARAPHHPRKCCLVAWRQWVTWTLARAGDLGPLWISLGAHDKNGGENRGLALSGCMCAIVRPGVHSQSSPEYYFVYAWNENSVDCSSWFRSIASWAAEPQDGRESPHPSSCLATDTRRSAHFFCRGGGGASSKCFRPLVVFCVVYTREVKEKKNTSHDRNTQLAPAAAERSSFPTDCMENVTEKSFVCLHVQKSSRWADILNFKIFPTTLLDG